MTLNFPGAREQVFGRPAPAFGFFEQFVLRQLWSRKRVRIEGELPGKAGDPGQTGKDNRLFVEAVLWIARTGCPWRDLPAEFGKWFSVYTRFWRWSQKGVWERVFKALSDDPDFEYVMIANGRDPTGYGSVRRLGH